MKRLSLSLRATCPFTQRLLHICRFIGIHFEQHSLQHMDKLGSLQLLCIPRMFRSGVLPNIEFPIESWVDYNYGWSVISFYYIFIPLVIIYIYSDCGKQPLKKKQSCKCEMQSSKCFECHKIFKAFDCTHIKIKCVKLTSCICGDI